MAAAIDAVFGTFYELSENDEVLLPAFFNSISGGTAVAFQNGATGLRSPVTEWERSDYVATRILFDLVKYFN